MTNIPTPELVERLRFRAWLQNETAGERQVRHLAEREEAAAAIAKLTAEQDAMLQELKAATGHDDGLVAIRHLVLRATQAENYITATEESGK